MGQMLNIKRLYLLLGKQWFENRKAYMLFFAAVIALLSGWLLFFLMAGSPYLFDQGNQASIYFAGLFIAGFLSSSFLFADFSSKSKKINYHMLPAAALEKLLCALFYGVLIFFIVYTALFYIADIVAVHMSNNATGAMANDSSTKGLEWRRQYDIGGQWNPARVVNVFSPSADMFIFYPGDNADLFKTFFPMQSAFILGAVYFRKNSFFKTIIALLAVMLLFFILESKILFTMLPETVRGYRLGTLAIVADKNGDDKIYTLPYWVGSVMEFLLRFGLTPALWVATYYRLKETEL